MHAMSVAPKMSGRWTHVLPRVAKDLSGSMITKQIHATTQHLNNTFHDFHERRFEETHGGSLSQNVEGFAVDSGGVLEESPFCTFSLDMYQTRRVGGLGSRVLSGFGSQTQ